jgi:hypothetical protein
MIIDVKAFLDLPALNLAVVLLLLGGFQAVRLHHSIPLGRLLLPQMRIHIMPPDRFTLGILCVLKQAMRLAGLQRSNDRLLHRRVITTRVLSLSKDIVPIPISCLALQRPQQAPPLKRPYKAHRLKPSGHHRSGE